MAEGKPPLAGINPYRALFLIPTKSPPTLSEPEKWSDEFNDWVQQCLQKDPDDRPTAKELLNHPFIRKAKTTKILTETIEKVIQKILEAGGKSKLLQDEEVKNIIPRCLSI
jgi:serine/threonine protein kinase